VHRVSSCCVECPPAIAFQVWRAAANARSGLGLPTFASLAQLTYPVTGAGRSRFITSEMLNAICERLVEKPGLYPDELMVYVHDEFHVLVAPLPFIPDGVRRGTSTAYAY
jgi:hypothetical protein